MATLTQPLLGVKTVAKEEMVVRFDIHQRLQHMVMIASFTMLAFTGLPQKFNTWAISQWWVSLWGGIETVRSLHHFFGWVMLGDAIYHALYLFVNTFIRRRPLSLAIIPSPKDFKDLYQEIRHWVGLSHQEPSYGRYNWREKFDYWAVFWGIPILGLSGLILMYPVPVTRFLPGAAIPMALVAHSDEAFLAVAWIFGVHLFFTHLHPLVFPLNTSIFTGKVPLGRYQREHPLEWEQREKARSAAALVSAGRATVVEWEGIVPDGTAQEAELATLEEEEYRLLQPDSLEMEPPDSVR